MDLPFSLFCGKEAVFHVFFSWEIKKKEIESVLFSMPEEVRFSLNSLRLLVESSTEVATKRSAKCLEEGLGDEGHTNGLQMQQKPNPSNRQAKQNHLLNAFIAIEKNNKIQRPTLPHMSSKTGLADRPSRQA